jgi:hypothetical protein
MLNIGWGLVNLDIGISSRKSKLKLANAFSRMDT